MRAAAYRLAAFSAFVLSIVAQPAQAASFTCQEGVATPPLMTLAGAAARVARENALDILAIGSSSTEGVGATSREKSYPARLKALLARAWPQVKLDVVNAGIGGETAPETLARLKQALAQKRHDLVLWQVGTNDAVRGADIGAFRAMVKEGIESVRKAGSTLVILDQQFYPGIRDLSSYGRYVEAVAQMASEARVPVVSRFRQMRGWYEHDAGSFSGALASDGFHLSDAGYDCWARGVAAALEGMITPARPNIAFAF